MKIRINVLIATITGGLFVMLLAFVLAYQWPSLVEKYAVRNTNQAGEVDTSGWKTYRDEELGYSVKMPSKNYDFGRTGNVHYYSNQENRSIYEMEGGGYGLGIMVATSSESINFNEVYKSIERKMKIYSKYQVSNIDNIIFQIIKFGEPNVDTENVFALQASAASNLRNITIRLDALNKDDLLLYEPLFIQIVKSFRFEITL
ncbi:hypothetical protein HY411_00585 [Candidatus Gottesmanbacteria bacterium]|nr:hypothetical protein [Candidatus Gottesmanbacteria bacterium]